MKKNILPVVLMAMIGSFIMTGCATVKPYQKAYINDAEMELSARKSEQSENSFQSYREGAAGANGGKTGGGCGCN